MAGGSGFSCSRELSTPLRIEQYYYQMAVGGPTAQISSITYTATSASTMRETAGPTATVKASFVESLGLAAC